MSHRFEGCFLPGWAIVASLSMLLLSSCSSSQEQDKLSINANIPILTKTEPGMFPPDLQSSAMRPKATDLEAGEVARSLRVISGAMSKYPPALLKASLKRVYIVRDVQIYGVPTGGTWSWDSVYIANNGVRAGYSDEYLKGTFHHELSSVLMSKHWEQFPQSEWSDANPPGFQYRSSGAEAVRRGHSSQVLDVKLNQMGFLSQYSTADMQEDFNTIAQQLFMGKSSFWNAVDRNKRLKDKVDLAIRFYHTLNPMFTEDYFRRIK